MGKDKGEFMQRRCQVIRLHAESCEEYIRYHKQVWPTVLATLSACNIKNYSIYLHEDLLVAYFEYHGEDYISDMAKMARDPETRRWWSIMDPMQSPLLQTSPNQRWLELREIFHTD
jgi:L-rhamnose mutarotase